MPLAQTQFALALLDRDRTSPPGLAGADRFAVYRNNVHMSLIEALETRFPVTAALVGASFFRGMARSFIGLCPPRSPLLMTWGDALPDFIELFPPAKPVPYLADVARLEVARTEAYHAAEAPAMNPADLAAIPSDAWERARIHLHPSVRTVSSIWPVASIWQAHQAEERFETGLAWQAEDVLICRPDWSVEVHRLPTAAAAFVGSLASGSNLSEAAACFAAGARADGVTLCLSILVAAQVISAIG